MITVLCQDSRTAQRLTALVEHGTIRDALCEAEIDEPVRVATVPTIGVCLDLSTAHVPFTERGLPDFGDVRSCAHEHGWVVFVPSRDIAEGAHQGEPKDFGCPVWFQPILLLAWQWSALLINFDSDGPQHPGLALYDW